MGLLKPVTSGDLVKLAEISLSGTVATLELTNIPQQHRHLRLIVAARSDAATTVVGLALRMNADSGANYEHQRQFAQTTTMGAERATTLGQLFTAGIPAANATAGQFGGVTMDLPDYARTDKRKTALCHCVFEGSAEVHHGIWRSTAAINRLTLFCSGGGFVAGSSVSLYGYR